MTKQTFNSVMEACAAIAVLAADAEGGTWRVTERAGKIEVEAPESGYCVGGAGVDGMSWVRNTPFNAGQINEFVYARTGFAKERVSNIRASATIGLWRDGETGKWWLDAVTVCAYTVEGQSRAARREYALGLAALRGELAIWCIDENGEYRV